MYYPGRERFSHFSFTSFFFGLFWSILSADSFCELRTLSGKGQGGEAAEETKEPGANGRAAQTEISTN